MSRWEGARGDALNSVAFAVVRNCTWVESSIMGLDGSVLSEAVCLLMPSSSCLPPENIDVHE
ncbi:MAG: hypothetical protein CMM07_04675 [Rhodopirellula sp.]|nr:hypothetical protein [Rhodopirellula sp.]